MYCDKKYYYPGEKVIVTVNDVTNKYIHITDFNKKNIIQINLHFKSINNNLKIYSASFELDRSLESNVYLVNYNNIFFPITILSKKQRDITIVYPINTIEAYNKYGGKNLYHSYLDEDKEKSYDNRARKLSYKRQIEPQSQIFLFESEFIKWFTQQNYSMKYITDHQLDDLYSFNDSKLLIIIGHNEYITRKAVENIQQYINSGRNMLVLSGNTFWWQVRYEDAMNTIVCYKNTEHDPIKETGFKTVNLPNQMDIYSIIGLDFRLGGYGRKKEKIYEDYCKIKNLSNNGKLLDNKIDYTKIKQKTNYNGNIIPGFGGIKILEDHNLFENIVKKNDVLKISSAESDGFKVTSFINNKLLYDKSDFYRYKVLGYDLLWRSGLTIAGFICCQKTETSGIVINTGTTDWCSKQGMGGSSSKEIKQITKNMIDTLILKKDVIVNKIF